MKYTATKYLATVTVLVTVFVLGIAPKARAGEDEPCSNATLNGSFGYTSTGTLLPSYAPAPFFGPFAEVGRQTFDGNGHTEATATTSSNGNVVPVTIEGTYSVNKDCTGSMTVNVSPFGSVVHADFVIDDHGAEIRAIGTDTGVIETRVYKKQFREGRQENAKLTPGAHQLLHSFPAPAPVQVSGISQLGPARALSTSKTEVC
jgi:hypothetical protein